MELGVLSRENTYVGERPAAACGVGSGVHVDAVEVVGLDDAGLDLRLRLIGRARNRLDGYLAEVVAEKKRRSCAFDAKGALQDGLRQSGREAQRIVDEAERLESLPVAREALVDSRITSEHARILGSAAKAGPLDEQKMVAAAESQSPEQLRRTVRAHQDELSGGDDGSKRLERQKNARTATFGERDDGMWCLYGLFDPVTAQRIRAALNHRTDMAWHAAGGREHREVRHRRADAIAELLTRTTEDDGEDGIRERPQPTSLLILADYDVIDHKLGRPRLADGTPLTDGEFRELACDAEVLTGIFNRDLECLSLGRQRHPSPQLRATLIARDQGCIGCAKEPEWCVSHHIEHWQHGGPTRPDNLVLVCHDCHHKTHHRNWKVEKHPDTGRPYLRPPWQQPPKPTQRR
ncbi:HNH endonuclease [Candidatus Poriferisocius sp.]|uniref:HNH endonuclease signature motif containing protein n=1 Tax=Candidatus Poriferisocius sp. TaxID=3101276 RepID=UPI003B01490C